MLKEGAERESHPVNASSPLTIATMLLVLVPCLARAQATQPPAPAPTPAPSTELPPAASTSASTAASTSASTAGAPAPQPEPAPASPAVAVAAPAPPGAPIPSPSAVEFASLRLMRDKAIITQGEYDSAVRDLTESTGFRAPEQGTVVLGKWATTMYGFVEDDNIYDTTRSFNDLAGAGLVARAETQAGQNGRFTASVRNSRIGFRLKAPELSNGVRASAMLEMDFLGTQAVGSGSGQVSEGAFFTSPLLRIRHFNFKVETPIVDLLVGQYWQLFGWQSVYQPNSVELQGLPGELYSRTPQVRITKTIKAHPVTIELALAATRPVQRDSAAPDGEGGIRVALDTWTGVQTVGATGSTVSPLSVAATGLLRHVAVDQFSASPKSTKDIGLSAFALDAFVPVIPGTKTRKDNSFSLNGEYATGYGFADMYTSLSGGVAYPPLPAPAGGGTAPAYTPNIDSGIVSYDAGGGLHGIQWTTFLIGAQYYVPGLDGALWISGNYSHTSSDNAGRFGAPAKVRQVEDWFDVSLFVDPTPAVRIGIEYANYNDMYFDGNHAINHRGQLSGFFIY